MPNVNQKNIQKKFTYEIYGAAHCLYFKCNACNHQCTVQANRSNSANSSTPIPFLLQGNKKRVNISDFDINKKLLMAAQQTGRGMADTSVYTTFLGITIGSMKNSWTELIDNIHQSLKKLYDQVIHENIEYEMSFSSRCK